MKLTWLVSVLCMTLAYCGGGTGGGGGGSSGVDPTKTIGELSGSEIRDLCEYFSTLQEQPERTVDCGDGVTTTVGLNPEDVQASIDECVADAPLGTCPATVADAESCFEAFSEFTDAQLCEQANGGGTLPVECAPLFESEGCG